MKKKHILIIICLGLILSTCSCSVKKSSWNSSTELNILVFDGEISLNPAAALEKYQLWETEFNNVYDENINLEAKLIKPWAFSDNMGDYEFEAEVQDFTSGGILIMPTAAYNSLFSEREKFFEPIDKYMIGSELYFEWPESLVEFGYFPGDEKTWCLPTQYYTSIMFRAYNKDALANIGMSAPTTVDELFTALGRYYMDYEKPPISINPEESNSLTQFSDIFALGGSRSLDTIVYDFTSQKYRNIIDLDSTEAILNMLKDWFYGGIISSDSTLVTNNSFALVSDNDVFTSLVRGPSIMVYDEIIYSNINYEQNSLVYVDREQIPYVAVLLKGTENAEKVVNKFIDTFLLNGEKYIAGSKGYEGIHYENKDGILVPLMRPSYKLGTISLFSDYDIENYIKDKERDAYIEYKEAYMAEQHKIEPYYLMHFLKLNVFEDTKQENEIQNLFVNVFGKLFTEDTTIEELIEEYRSLCYDNSVDNYIDLANYELNTLLEGSEITD